MVRMSLVEITPKWAEKHIPRNNTNVRPLLQTWVEKYAKIMLAGGWMLTGQAIEIDEQGNLLNGNHRLHAVIKSGVTIQCYVAFGVKKKAFSCIDVGRPRTAGDLIGIFEGNMGTAINFSLARHLAGAIKFLSYLAGTKKLDANGTLDKWANIRERLLQAAVLVLRPEIKDRDAASKLISQGREIALCYRFLEKNEALADFFWFNFLTPNSNSTIVELCKQRLFVLTTQRERFTDYAPTGFYLQLAKVIIHAWNLLQEGSRITRQAGFMKNRDRAEKWVIL